MLQCPRKDETTRSKTKTIREREGDEEMGWRM
jgi:hypothetical protein